MDHKAIKRQQRQYIEELTKEVIAYAKKLLVKKVDRKIIIEDLQMLYFIDEESAIWALQKAKNTMS